MRRAERELLRLLLAGKVGPPVHGGIECDEIRAGSNGAYMCVREATQRITMGSGSVTNLCGPHAGALKRTFGPRIVSVERIAQASAPGCR